MNSEQTKLCALGSFEPGNPIRPKVVTQSPVNWGVRPTLPPPLSFLQALLLRVREERDEFSPKK